MTNRLRTCTLLLAAFLCMMTGAQAQAPVPSVQGWYDYCYPSDPACPTHLDQMHSGGFTLVVNYAVLYNSSAAQVIAYADHAASLGMKIAWDLSDSAFFPNANPGPIANFPQFAATCGCSDTNSFITYYVNLVKNHPATWGYYIGDETDPANASYVNQWSALVHQLDPNHPRLFVCLGDPSLATMQSELVPFLPGADLIGDDFYPFGGPGTTITDFANVTANLQTIANQGGKQSVVVEQAMSWGEYPDEGWCTPFPSCEPFPTESQMAQLRTVSLQNAQPAILLWYSYFDLWNYNNAAQHWADAVKAAGPPVPVNLSSVFNATGLHSDGTVFSDGGFDGVGDACSANLLGSSVAWSGVAFNLGTADKPNTIATAGNVISLPSSKFSSLKMIGAAVNGAQTSQSFKVTYSDGTTTTFKQSMSDWDTPNSYSGESKAVKMSYVDSNDGTNYSGPNFLYGYSFSLNNAKTVKSIQLPNNANVKIVAITLVP